jgi:hypothetical protein
MQQYMGAPCLPAPGLRRHWVHFVLISHWFCEVALEMPILRALQDFSRVTSGPKSAYGGLLACPPRLR